MSDPNNKEKQISASVDIHVAVFGRTDVGLVREHNEDNFLVADLSAGNRSIKPEVQNHRLGPRGSIFAVCDGMGGAAAGEVASQIAVDTIYDMMQKSKAATGDESLARKLERAVCEAGRRILTAAKINRSQRGMGTTVTAAALIGPRLIIGQVGDSRAYILRGRKLVQVTKDQSLVQQLIDAKQMTEEEAKTFDKNNIILQALGTSEEVHVDVTSVTLKKGDRLVMCSDGLSGLVENETIREVVSKCPNPVKACKILTEKACRNGGHDNITAIVAVFDGDSLDAPPPPEDEDQELVYNRFAFSRTSENTARKMRPAESLAPKAPPKKTTQPAEARPKPKKIKTSPKRPARRLHVISLTTALIAFTITVIATLLTRREEDTSSAVAAPPSDPPRPTVSSPLKESFQQPSPSQEPPRLPPTPEAAITKSRGKTYGSEPKSENRSSNAPDRDKIEPNKADSTEGELEDSPILSDKASKDDAENGEKNLSEKVDSTKTPHNVSGTVSGASPQEEIVQNDAKTKKAPIPDNPFAED